MNAVFLLHQYMSEDWRKYIYPKTFMKFIFKFLTPNTRASFSCTYEQFFTYLQKPAVAINRDIFYV